MLITCILAGDPFFPMQPLQKLVEYYFVKNNICNCKHRYLLFQIKEFLCTLFGIYKYEKFEFLLPPYYYHCHSKAWGSYFALWHMNLLSRVISATTRRLVIDYTMVGDSVKGFRFSIRSPGSLANR